LLKSIGDIISFKFLFLPKIIILVKRCKIQTITDISHHRAFRFTSQVLLQIRVFMVHT